MTREQEKHRRAYQQVYSRIRNADPETRRRLMFRLFHQHHHGAVQPSSVLYTVPKKASA